MCFVLRGLDDAMAKAAREMEFAEGHGGWFRAFPRAGSSFVDDAYAGFARHAVDLVEQQAHKGTVPWRAALRTTLRAASDAAVDLFLVGSAALAARGVDIEPGDVDLVTTADDAVKLGDALREHLIEPVCDVEWISQRWGRAWLGCRVEWAGGVHDSVDEPLPVDFGPAAWAASDVVEIEGFAVQVPPLGLARSVNERRGRIDRVAAIDRFRAPA